MKLNLVTTTEAAAILGVTPGRVRQYVMTGVLKPEVRATGRMFFKPSDIAKFKRQPTGRPRGKA